MTSPNNITTFFLRAVAAVELVPALDFRAETMEGGRPNIRQKFSSVASKTCTFPDSWLRLTTFLAYHPIL